MTDGSRGHIATLPAELIHEILCHLAPPAPSSPWAITSNRYARRTRNSLLDTSLVNRCFYTQSAPLLWNKIAVTDDLDRHLSIFETLSSSPRLCHLIQHFETRSPLRQCEKMVHVREWRRKSFKNMSELRVFACDESNLEDFLGASLSQKVEGKMKLHTLKLHSDFEPQLADMLWKVVTRRRSQDPEGMGEYLFPSLSNLELDSPRKAIEQAAIEISKRRPLKSISYYFSSPSQELASTLGQLEKLFLCKSQRIDGSGLEKLLKGSEKGVKELGLQHCTVHPSSYPSLRPLLQDSLHTLTLTFPALVAYSEVEFYTGLNTLVAGLRSLQEFTLQCGLALSRRNEPIPDILAPGKFGDLTSASQIDHVTEVSDLVSLIPLSLLKALFIDRRVDDERRTSRLKLLRLDGGSCSTEGVALIGREGQGLQNLIVEVDYTPIETLLHYLSPLSATLKPQSIHFHGGSWPQWLEIKLEDLGPDLIHCPLWVHFGREIRDDFFPRD